jgi:Isocitrate/isopropylmalate dehydrogenase
MLRNAISTAVRSHRSQFVSGMPRRPHDSHTDYMTEDSHHTLRWIPKSNPKSTPIFFISLQLKLTSSHLSYPLNMAECTQCVHNLCDLKLATSHLRPGHSHSRRWRRCRNHRIGERDIRACECPHRVGAIQCVRHVFCRRGFIQPSDGQFEAEQGGSKGSILFRFYPPVPRLTLSAGILFTPISQSGHISWNVAMRQQLDIYASVVLCKSLPGFPTRHANVDFAIIRENTEGEYSGLEHQSYPGVVESLKVSTRAKAERIARFAFDFALKNNRKVALFGGFFSKRFVSLNMPVSRKLPACTRPTS